MVICSNSNDIDIEECFGLILHGISKISKIIDQEDVCEFNKGLPLVIKASPS